MNKKECLQLIEKYFELESFVRDLKAPDFQIKSHIFYFRGLFKDIQELRILRVRSKNKEDHIIFDIYYVSGMLEGLYHGYFRIKPESPMAKKVFENMSRVCTDLGYYLYDVYRNSDFLKIYLISGNLQNALEQSKHKDFHLAFEEIKKLSYTEIAGYEAKDLYKGLLRRDDLQKHITNFIDFNAKCSEKVKMFLITLLSHPYRDHVCLIHHGMHIKNFIHIDTRKIFFHGDNTMPIYGLLDYAVAQDFILFIRLEFDFEGGGNIGKTIG
ncbi:hypothetical protein QBE52_01955 [Clostridiaceae bacterium 35-E11]